MGMEGCTIDSVRRRAPLLLIVLLWSCSGCFYLGPADPCEDEPLPPTEFEFHACWPPKGSVIVVTETWADVPLRCDITGATEINWWVRARGDSDRLQAEDTPRFTLTEAMLPWEPGLEQPQAQVLVDANNGVEFESTFWELRLVEEVP